MTLYNFFDLDNLNAIADIDIRYACSKEYGHAILVDIWYCGINVVERVPTTDVDFAIESALMKLASKLQHNLESCIVDIKKVATPEYRTVLNEFFRGCAKLLSNETTEI